MRREDLGRSPGQKAISHWPLARRHARGNLRRPGTREHPRSHPLGAPLCFEPATSKFRDALVSLIPPELSDADPCPGSLLSYIATLAAPGTFIWSRLTDAALSVTDGRALEIQARVERWILDEVSLLGKLVHQIMQWLYRENRFCRGTFKVRETLVGPSSLSVPTLAVVNMADDVAPLASVKPCIDAMPVRDVRTWRAALLISCAIAREHVINEAVLCDPPLNCPIRRHQAWPLCRAHSPFPLMRSWGVAS